MDNQKLNDRVPWPEPVKPSSGTIKYEKDAEEFVTKEEFDRRMSEIAKCKRDIAYFADNYYKIVNLDKGLMQLKMYDVQKGLLKHFVENNQAIVCSSRQMGKCVGEDSILKIKDKETGEVREVKAGELWAELETAEKEKER